MDQLGNTERITEEHGREDRQPEAAAGLGDAPRAYCTLAVYRAQPSAPGADPAGPYPDGFSGTLALQNLEAWSEDTVGEALGRVAHLLAWAQAQQARLLNRMEEIFREDFHAASGRLDPGMAFSLAASECATILNVPQVSGQRLLSEAHTLCSTHTATLAGLEEGRLSYRHAQVVLDQCQNVPEDALPEFEAGLLAAAQGVTRAQFSVRARRLREKQYPETVGPRHHDAFNQRRVTLDREEDGMSCLSAHLAAAEAQQIYTALSTAARGEQTAGDARTTDQLRADILAQLLMGGSLDHAAAAGSRTGGGPVSPDVEDGPDGGLIPRAEIMVLISAETLFGANDQPAELHGYGPISAEAARRLARNALHWTGLTQNPQTGEILWVGRRRKIPSGLRRWLRARDGTCRFPGCRVGTASADVDHTRDWAQGGPTDHGNLAHLCRRHHRFKTLGFWKASQPVPGVIEWTSPTGRVYRTDPFLQLGPPETEGETGAGQAADPRKHRLPADTAQKPPRQDPLPPPF